VEASYAASKVSHPPSAFAPGPAFSAGGNAAGRAEHEILSAGKIRAAALQSALDIVTGAWLKNMRAGGLHTRPVEGFLGGPLFTQECR
jgi:hypothetical protein